MAEIHVNPHSSVIPFFPRFGKVGDYLNICVVQPEAAAARLSRRPGSLRLTFKGVLPILVARHVYMGPE